MTHTVCRTNENVWRGCARTVELFVCLYLRVAENALDVGRSLIENYQAAISLWPSQGGFQESWNMVVSNKAMARREIHMVTEMGCNGDEVAFLREADV
jgi:hypothetical protein